MHFYRGFTSCELTIDLMSSILRRIVLGINGLFYVTNSLPLAISFCHILLVDVGDDVVRVANLMLVVNSSLKLLVYMSLSRDFRLSVRRLVAGDNLYHWMLELEKNHHFLNHLRVASSFVLTSELASTARLQNFYQQQNGQDEDDDDDVGDDNDEQ